VGGAGALATVPVRALATAGVLVLAAVLGSGSGSAEDSGAAGPGTADPAIYLVSHGWHVGLVLRRDDVPAGLWPERDALGHVRYLEVGWGDGDFYPARRGTVGLALRAAFRSRWSVLQVVGFDAPVTVMFPGSKILEVDLPAGGLAALARYIETTYARDRDGRAIAVAPAQYGVGVFYIARGHYSLRRGSNAWAARGLQVAGCPIDPDAAITAGGVLHQAVRFSRVIRPGVFVRGTDDSPVACR
jgi:uncharacterized protein (TIGR02117 family)